ncbi:protein kinase [Streptomyces sp. AC555_RSS877]|uniref:protein kinase domain-containing protein n=1 Tax=Streptomyces sp. AC555_RSS877 TaxID=2823688 RepID=UPI0027E53AF8|nr:protein kinase [Streptomyces sp. AC555_RSS877]
MQEGTVLDGRYRLIEAIGAGGFGQVWAAHDPKIDRLVAVKVLTGDAGSSRQVARFAREAAVAGGLAHPNIVTVHDFGSTTHNTMPRLSSSVRRGEGMPPVSSDTDRLATVAEARGPGGADRVTCRRRTGSGRTRPGRRT